MNPDSVFLAFQLAMIAAVLGLGAAMPWLTRRDVVFGVRLPEDFAASEPVRGLRRRYLRTYLAAAIAMAVLFAASAHLGPEPALGGVGVFAAVALMMVFYLVFRAKTLRLKEDAHVMLGRTQIAVTEIGVAAPENLVSWAWFLLPLAIVVLNALLGLTNYPALPDRIPMHFGPTGEPDSWAPKSVGVVLFMPAIQLTMTGAIMLAFWGFRRAKRQLSPRRPAASAQQQALFRRRWSQFFVAAATLMTLMMSALYWVTLGFVRLSGAGMMATILAPTGALVIGAIALSVRLGQGGARAAVSAPETNGDPTATSHDDDRFWKGGMFYYNPDDPAVFLEKRFGVGYTVNFARWQAWLFVAIPFLGIAAAMLLATRPASFDRHAFLARATPIADNFFDAFRQGDYDRAVRDFTPQMLEKLNAANMKEYTEGYLAQRLGKYESCGFDRLDRKAGYAVMRYRAKFTGDDVTVRLVFDPTDSSLKIGGLWFDSPKLRK